MHFCLLAKQNIRKTIKQKQKHQEKNKKANQQKCIEKHEKQGQQKTIKSKKIYRDQ